MRSCQAERLAAETVDERESRLQQMRDRLAAKSVEGMEMRLQQMSSSQRERLAAWNAEEREIRLQHPQGAASAPTQEPGNEAIQQHAVQAKMQKFHAQMAALEVSPTHRIIWLPLLIWNDTCLGDPHPICDQRFFFICPCMAISISDHNLRSCHCNNSIMHVYCALAQARPTMPCICLV